jgi:ABC-type Zn uptake system ZnuABC Zn-binding protein ZnuA
VRRIGAVGLALLIVAACGSTGSPNPSGPARLIVVATTTVFADLVSKVGGDLVTVRSLVPKGGEVHTFDPKPGDITTVADADLIVANGLGLDDWLAALARDAGATAPIIRLGENLDGAEYIKTEGAVNPHLWMDPTLASRYVARIGEALGEADSAHADDYVQRATEVEAQFGTLDASIHQKLGTIPASERRLVSFHDAFPYFARAYGLEIVGVVVQVPGQDPSAGEVASLVDAIRTANVRLILSEVQFSPALAEQIAAETGATVVSDLYDDSLGDPPVDSYEAILNWDADKIAEALK